VKLIIKASAEDDVLRQTDWYEQQGLSVIADRFAAAVFAAINAAIGEFRIYYMLRGDVFMVVRILHGRRDIDAILGTQVIDDHDAD
jgi:plasmid stabilization system protein ParE